MGSNANRLRKKWHAYSGKNAGMAEKSFFGTFTEFVIIVMGILAIIAIILFIIASKLLTRLDF